MVCLGGAENKDALQDDVGIGHAAVSDRAIYGLAYGWTLAVVNMKTVL